MNCRDERTINRIVSKNRFSTVITYKKGLSELNVNISWITLQRKMKDFKYVFRVPKRKPLLNIVQRKRRVQWAKEQVSRDLQFWKSIFQR